MTRRRFLLGVAGTCLALVILAALHPGTRSAVHRIFERPDPAVIAVRTEADLREVFNARPNTTRVVAFLSPT